MKTLKSYTDIEQSKKLAKILPIESADMRYSPPGDNMHPWIWTDTFIEKNAVPCWSLTSLLNYLREVDYFPEINADEFEVTMSITYFNDHEARLLAPVHNIKVFPIEIVLLSYEFLFFGDNFCIYGLISLYFLSITKSSISQKTFLFNCLAKLIACSTSEVQGHLYKIIKR